MTLRIFETDDAKYYLGLGNHLSSSAPIFEGVDFSSIDFMVLEFNPGAFDESVLKKRPYQELTEKVMKDNPKIPFYSVDLDWDVQKVITYVGIEGLVSGVGIAAALKSYMNDKHKAKTTSRRSFLKKAGQITAGIYAYGSLHPLTHGGKYSIPEIETFTNLHRIIFPTPIIGFRDSLAAKKISEYLVPKYKQENRKVKVAILYGAAHAGIESKLRFPSLNKIPLNTYQGLFSKIELNSIGIIQQEKGRLLEGYHYCNLF